MQLLWHIGKGREGFGPTVIIICYILRIAVRIHRENTLRNIIITIIITFIEIAQFMSPDKQNKNTAMQLQLVLTFTYFVIITIKPFPFILIIIIYRQMVSLCI